MQGSSFRQRFVSTQGNENPPPLRCALAAVIGSRTRRFCADTPPRHRLPEGISACRLRSRGVKIPTRDKVALNATLHLLKTKMDVLKDPGDFHSDALHPDTYHPRAAYCATRLRICACRCSRPRNSAGEFEPFANEPRDGYDVAEWFAQQPFCDGKVNVGGSYAGSINGQSEGVSAASTTIGRQRCASIARLPFRQQYRMTYDVQWFTLTMAAPQTIG